MEKPTTDKLIDYYWNYFQLHSNQRMQLINFYISIEVVLVGAYFTLILNCTSLPWVLKTVSFAISFFSVVFYLMDRRTVFLIKESERCFMEIENLVDDEKYRLISSVENKTSGNIIRNTYSKIVFFVYVLTFAFGIYALFK